MPSRTAAARTAPGAVRAAPAGRRRRRRRPPRPRPRPPPAIAPAHVRSRLLHGSWASLSRATAGRANTEVDIVALAENAYHRLQRRLTCWTARTPTRHAFLVKRPTRRPRPGT